MQGTQVSRMLDSWSQLVCLLGSNDQGLPMLFLEFGKEHPLWRVAVRGTVMQGHE
jgi:hypothetical protein